MVTSAQFNFSLIQGVLFTPDPSQFSQTSILATVLGQYASLYNGPVQALSLPDDVPEEIPRLVLTSKDERFKLQASPTRIDSVWIAQENEEFPGFAPCLDAL